MNKLLFGLPLVALVVLAGCKEQRSHSTSGTARGRTLSSFDAPAQGDTTTPAQAIKFEQAELEQVLNVYAEISGRSIIHGATLPEVKITFRNQTPMTAVESLRALDTVLADQGVTMVYLGSQYVKAVPAKEASREPGPVIELPPQQLPDSSSFLIYIVKLKNIPASRAAMALASFSQLPNSIVAIGPGGGGPPTAKTNPPLFPSNFLGKKENNVLILRDYSSNVKRMLQVLEQLDQ